VNTHLNAWASAGLLLAVVLGIAGCQPDKVHAAKTSPSASQARPSTSSHSRTSTSRPASKHATSKHATPTTSHRVAPKTTSAPALPPKPATSAAKPAPVRTSSSPRANCDSAYPDVCLRDGSGDYDCAGGSGNGPNYVDGPIQVRAPDPFGLDADHDGVGCERG
jgi:hypothetical protein